MKEYICTEVVDLHTGRVGLTKTQAERRGRNLAPVKGQDGVYDVVSSVQFKAGETIRIKNPDKATLSRIVPVVGKDQDVKAAPSAGTKKTKKTSSKL